MMQAAIAQPVPKPLSGILLKEFGKATKLYQKGRLAPAREILERIVSRHPDHTDSINNLAAIAGRMGDLQTALNYAVRAVKLDPTSALFIRNVGQILFQMSRYGQAAEAFRIGAQLEPHNAHAHSLHGMALRYAERWDEATAASLRAIELDPTVSDAFDNLAVTLAMHSEYDKAEQLFREAVRLAPRSSVAWNNLGTFLTTLGGRTAEAAEAFRRAIEFGPQHSAARMNFGMALLKLGDFENGWREYEHRWEGSILSTVRRPGAPAQWDGSAIPRTLLLHAEQGLGDTLQFCRYAPLAAARGHHVVLEVQPELVELLTGNLASDSVTVVARTELYPSLAGLPPLDAHCPLMSLPMALGTRLDSVPSAPYLRADPARCRAWEGRLAGIASGFRIGLVWAGNPRRDSQIGVRQIDARRSMTLKTLSPLLEVPGVSFVSLQKGAGVEELRTGHFPAIYDADPELHSFADTAALVANLDLVICVDTSVSHLVGGMGKPVWMLSRYDACFRWLEDRADSPWYPSMRIFRQGADHKWDPVVASLVKALAEVTQTSLAENSGSA
jgi:Flp pilus assembly protein TadD